MGIIDLLTIHDIFTVLYDPHIKPLFQRDRGNIQIKLLQLPEGFLWLVYEKCHLSYLFMDCPIDP